MRITLLVIEKKQPDEVDEFYKLDGKYEPKIKELETHVLELLKDTKIEPPKLKFLE